MVALQDSVFSLFADGKRLVRDLETHGALAFYAPLEGGYEGRYIRRIRANGYTAVKLTARGLGDPNTYLTGVHGVRPAHLGKRDIQTYFIPPIIETQLTGLSPRSKGLLIWILEGFVLSRQEIEFLCALPKLDPRVKVVVEMGGDRSLRWMPLKNTPV